MNVYVNGEIQTLQRNTLRIEKAIEERGTASFTVIDEDGDFTFTKGMPVLIYDGETLVFGGFIDTPERTRYAQGVLHLLNCVDNHYLTDKRIVIRAYNDQTFQDIVNDLWGRYLREEGITIGEIQDGPTITSAIFNYVKVSEAFNALKEISGYIWFVDEYKRLYFINRATYRSPWDMVGI